MFGSHGIGSSSVSFVMIFEALQSELFKFKFDSLSLKIPEFNLLIRPMTYQIIYKVFFYFLLHFYYLIDIYCGCCRSGSSCGGTGGR